MFAQLSGGLRAVGPEWFWIGVGVVLGLVMCLAGFARRSRMQRDEQRIRERVREELEAYMQFDAHVPVDGNMRELAQRVCRMIVSKSKFYRAAMLVRDGAGRFVVAGSSGMDEQIVDALKAWGDEAAAVERSNAGIVQGSDGWGMRVGGKSFAVVLGKEPAAVWCGRAIVTPMWTAGGRMVGALAVCADGLLSVRRRTVAEAMIALEGLAVKLGRSIENAALAERLMKSEKLAGLGLMAGGVAHALNNPLTAVIGFAELIAHTTSETRVQEDAETIVREAKRMRETVENLTNYWRPAIDADEMVEVPELLRELAGACAAKLENSRIRLVVQTGDAVPAVRGNRERLRQVVEHLLNNAAQAVGAAREMGVVSPLNDEDGEEHTIRLMLSHREHVLHLIVSDTGPGFREPARIFDPFYVAKIRRDEGAGLGLSLCYGIVHEHGGEISAFNLNPHGAAVMVELPVERREAVAGHLASTARDVA